MKIKYTVSLGEEFLNSRLGFIRLFEGSPTYFETEAEAEAEAFKFAENFIDFIEIESVSLSL